MRRGHVRDTGNGWLGSGLIGAFRTPEMAGR